MKLRLIVAGATLIATMDDNAATRHFVSLLPLRVTLRDYEGTEKMGELPRRLSIQGTPRGGDPDAGDLAYYAPWGNLAVDFGYSTGLVRLGRIESGLEKLAPKRGEFVVRFEAIEAGD